MGADPESGRTAGVWRAARSSQEGSGRRDRGLCGATDTRRRRHRVSESTILSQHRDGCGPRVSRFRVASQSGHSSVPRRWHSSRPVFRRGLGVGVLHVAAAARVGERGGFDERYFMYVEDMDLCFRLRRAGWNTVYEPASTVTHSRGQSSRHRPLRSVLHHHVGAARFYWRSASRWHQPITWPLAVLALTVRGAAQVSVGALRAVR